MGRRQILWASCVLIVITVAVIGAALKSNTLPESDAKVDKSNDKSVFRALQEARVVAVAKWSVEDSEEAGLLCVVQAFNQNPDYEGAGMKLTIFNQAGAVIYEDHFSNVHSMYSSYVLRQGSPQLVLEIDYGGSASFLKMLDYKNGKVVNLMEAVKPNSDFTINAEVRPQLRSGINSAAEPYQILLTEGVGLASPVEKYTEVFRYMNGAYRYVGKFSQQKVDNYIEDLMKRPSNQPKSQK